MSNGHEDDDDISEEATVHFMAVRFVRQVSKQASKQVSNDDSSQYGKTFDTWLKNSNPAGRGVFQSD